MEILEKPANSNIVREINAEMSVRKGKYGDYIFYKTGKMKKPRFLIENCRQKGSLKNRLFVSWGPQGPPQNTSKTHPRRKLEFD